MTAPQRSHFIGHILLKLLKWCWPPAPAYFQHHFIISEFYLAQVCCISYSSYPMTLFNLISVSARIFLLFLYLSCLSLDQTSFPFKDMIKPNKRQAINNFCTIYKWSDVLIPWSPIVPFQCCYRYFLCVLRHFQLSCIPSQIVFFYIFCHNSSTTIESMSLHSLNPLIPMGALPNKAYLPIGNFQIFYLFE